MPSRFYTVLAPALVLTCVRPTAACDPGKFCPVLRACSLIGCVQCEEGQFSLGDPAKNGSSSEPTRCSKCKEGQYSNSIGASSCRLCGSGQYTGTKGATSCIDCEPGQYTGTKGATSCIDCEPGQYSGTKGATSCIDCEPGQYSGTKGATSCIDCGPFEYSVGSDASSCHACEAGQHSNAKHSQCDPYCANGPSSFHLNSTRAAKGIVLDYASSGTKAQVHLQPDGRGVVTPLDESGWFPGAEFLYPTSSSTAKANAHGLEISCLCNSPKCSLSAPPCGLHCCCNPVTNDCVCPDAEYWTGETCDRRPLTKWPEGQSVLFAQTVFVTLGFAITTTVGMRRVATVHSWRTNGTIPTLPANRWQRLLAIFVLVEYAQIGGTAFRRTVPWTSVDFSRPTSIRSIFAYLHVLVRVVLVEYRPGFIWQFWILLIGFASLSLLGVRKWFQRQSDEWKGTVVASVPSAMAMSVCIGITAGIMCAITSDEFDINNSKRAESPEQDDAYTMSIVLLAVALGIFAIAGSVYAFARTQQPGEDEVSLFDFFVQFVLPELLIPVVRRLFAPILGCVFYYPHENSTCGATACLERMPTMACSFRSADWHYTLMFIAGTGLLIPAWAGILHAMVIFQGDVSGSKPPRWPVLPEFIVFHGQIKVVVAMATDSLHEHPEVMLCVIFVASCADLAFVVTWQPNQHLPLTHYRRHGGVFAVWSCVCAFWALRVDDRTDVSSIALLCAGCACYLGYQVAGKCCRGRATTISSTVSLVSNVVGSE